MKAVSLIPIYACALMCLGCGSGLEKFPLTEVSGTVLCEGQPVPNAMVYFEPIRGDSESAEIGKQGYALTDAEGKFVVSTYGENDGAVVGKHLVRVGKSETSPDCPCALNAAQVLTEVQVVDGDPQEFELVLKKKSARNRDEVIVDDEDD